MKLLTAEGIAADFGNDAAHRGEGRETNPYSPNYYLYSWWDLGWLECHPDDFGIERKERKFNNKGDDG